MGGDSRSLSPNKSDLKIETALSQNTLSAEAIINDCADSKANLENTTHDTKRNKELHQKFPEILASGNFMKMQSEILELLIENYVCALCRGAKLIQGF